MTTSDNFCIFYILVTNFEFSACSVKFRKEEINRKSLRNPCLPMRSQYAQFVTLCTQELISDGKHLRGCGNWLWDFLMLFKVEELIITAGNPGTGNASQIIEWHLAQQVQWHQKAHLESLGPVFILNMLFQNCSRVVIGLVTLEQETQPWQF